MRVYSYAWSLPVRWVRWWLDHSIHHRQKPHTACKLYRSNRCVIETELLSIQVLHSGHRDFFLPFLLLWSWPGPYDLHIWTWPVFSKMYQMSEKELPMSSLTDIHPRNTMPHRFTSGQLLNYRTCKLRLVYADRPHIKENGDRKLVKNRQLRATTWLTSVTSHWPCLSAVSRLLVTVTYFNYNTLCTNST